MLLTMSSFQALRRLQVFLLTSLLVVCLLLLAGVPVTAAEIDPLPSWNEGEVKRGIIDFVDRVTAEDNPDFVPQQQRIATIDNDGTLWPEMPLIQGVFIRDRLAQRVATDPSLKEKQPYKAILEGDLAYFSRLPGSEVTALLSAVYGNATQAEYEADVRAFFANKQHPILGVPYTELAYLPMVELLDYLRDNGFQTWICSGGGIDFIRAVSQQLYGIPPQQVIGSSIEKEFIEQDGKFILQRLPQLGSFNDKAIKPVNIDLHIGRRPVFAAGNVKSGGDIAMLTYSQGREGASFQLLINHDDREREFAYQEADNASLNAAVARGWTVVSIKNDWQRVFSFQNRLDSKT